TYDYTKERVFPEMVLCNDELVITSSQGIFICNTINLKCHYIRHAFNKNSIYLTGLKNKVVVYDGKNWFVYQNGNTLQQLSTVGKIAKEESYNLQHVVYNDTMYLINNPHGVLQELIVDGNKIKVVKERLM